MELDRTSLGIPAKRLLLSTVMAVAAALAVAGPASAADEDVVTCSLRSLRGVYDFSASGFNIMNGVAAPKAIIERLVFDGRGGVLTPAVSLSINGNIVQPPQGNPGTYTVDANCTGTLTFADGPSFDFHIAPRDRSLRMLQTNSGTVMQGSATRVLSLAAWGG